MGIINSNKASSAAHIGCGDSFQVTLSLSAAPDIKNHPKDIVLVLDRSGSMGSIPLAELKKGVCQFLDIVDEASNSSLDGCIGGGSQAAIVSFATTAIIDQPLTTSVADLKAAVNALASGGSTNHADAFRKALDAFDTSSVNDKILIIFTDGESNHGFEGFAEAEAIKAQGITIYSIGFGSEKSLNINALNAWASSPSSAYTLIIPDHSDIQKAFANLVQNISRSGASNIMLTDTISDCFKILSVKTPDKGTVNILDDHSIRWRIDKLGTTASEGAVCTFTVQHAGSCSGNTEVNKSVAYSDDEGNIVTFISPVVDVVCNQPVIIEECPAAYDVTVGNCTDSVEYDAGDLVMSSLGRVLQLSVTLKNICPNKRVSLAAVLYEVDEQGNEHSRGMKTMLIPAQTGRRCTDILIRCIRFVLPEELDLRGDPDSLCNARYLKARFMANYTDTDFYCCEDK